jgi:hypothetical protein
MELWLGRHFLITNMLQTRTESFTKKHMKRLFLFHKNESLDTN